MVSNLVSTHCCRGMTSSQYLSELTAKVIRNGSPSGLQACLQRLGSVTPLFSFQPLCLPSRPVTRARTVSRETTALSTLLRVKNSTACVVKPILTVGLGSIPRNNVPATPSSTTTSGASTTSGVGNLNSFSSLLAWSSHCSSLRHLEHWPNKYDRRPQGHLP